MLKQLHIINFILIEEAVISFHKGFNVITGESGAGKSSIMAALKVVTGMRTGGTALRKGAAKGSVEALFEISERPEILSLLSAGGINHDLEGELIIRREISASRKSRAYLNNQAVQLSFLRQVAEQLINIIDERSIRTFFTCDYQRELLDIYGSLEHDVAAFRASWAKELNATKELETLIDNSEKWQQDKEHSLRELAEIDGAAIKESEEEELFAEYNRLTKSEELTGQCRALIKALSGETHGIIAQLHHGKSHVDKLTAIDDTLRQPLRPYCDALIELQEVAYALNSYRSSIECDPRRTEVVNRRLQLINEVKRKYGDELGEISAYRDALIRKLAELESSDSEIETLRAKLQKLREKNDAKCRWLSSRRSALAAKFANAIIEQLRELNMEKIEFELQISQRRRGGTGEDEVEFFIVPNVGEKMVPLKECGSAGELSRVALAIHAELAEKNKVPTLVFDEIDANIGGTTAAKVGEKLRAISVDHQLLCITHFPQLAKHADHHLQISKEEVKGRTNSIVTPLDSLGREREYHRMVGGNNRATTNEGAAFFYNS